jgi:H+-transporting ATPase
MSEQNLNEQSRNILLVNEIPMTPMEGNPIELVEIGHAVNEAVVIQIVRKKSTTDTIRKASEPRILSQGDLRMVDHLIKKARAEKGHAEEKTDGKSLLTSEEEIDKDPLYLDDKFEYSHGLTTGDAEQRLLIHGLNCLPEKIIPKWYIFVSQLWEPMPIMIWLAAIIEAGIQNFIDMAILLLIQLANASIGFYEIIKAGDAVAALKASLKPCATVKRDGIWQNINATLVVPGDLVLLACGSAVPADCRINEGQVDIDQSGLTGESLPVTMFKGDSCKMGSTVVRGEVEGTVEYTGANT